jgi:hypothetical protein
MRVTSVREFRDKVTGFLRSRDPLLITRRGRLAGIFFPTPEATLPRELKSELFTCLSAEIGRRIRRQGQSEKDVEAGFESWRKTRSTNHRRR